MSEEKKSEKNAVPYSIRIQRLVPIPKWKKVKAKLNSMKQASDVRKRNKRSEWRSRLLKPVKLYGSIVIYTDFMKLIKYILR